MSRVLSQDLVLTVSNQGDFTVDPYRRFLGKLTLLGGPHQFEALETACRYLFGGHYENLGELAAENWEHNEKIRDHHNNQRDRFDRLQELSSLLSGSIDHATGTGKSYVIFGAAAVALASGKVDRVLVLCPSKTIEEGLTAKFRELSTDRSLMELLPDDAVVRAPAVVNAYEGTVPVGSICVENIHAAYERSLSSIRDSFAGNGERTLVINDEAHHVYTIEAGSGTKKIKKWLSFLLDPTFGFRGVLNVSGTCFIGDDYFPDVIHRYSVQAAREERRIKDIRYWDEGQDFSSPRERWSAVLQNHQANQELFPEIKPITIFVTDKVAKAKDIHEEFTAFLAETMELGDQAASERTLVVSSAREHEENVRTLRSVDQPGSKVEFIFSVSMLTEGWDVKNVLQIVPHEKRAFNSKLLISQVLGRGLRLLPAPYRDADAHLIIFNHAKWAPEIRRLFEDVWEDDQRIVSTVVAGSPNHFDLDLLEIERGGASVAASGTPFGRAAGEPLKLAPQRAKEVVGSFVGLGDEKDERRYVYVEPVVPLEEVLDEIAMMRAAVALETGNEVEADDAATLREVIIAALREAQVEDEVISATNRARILSWLRPTVAGPRMGFATVLERLNRKSTRALVAQSAGRNQLTRHVTAALRADNGRVIRLPDHDTHQYDLLDEFLDDRETRGAMIEVASAGRWRTPVDLVLVSHDPERLFLRSLLDRGEEVGINSWVKSPDSGFYAVPYAVAANGGTRNLTFNPDWFLKVADDVLVVETKMDGDITRENRAKLKNATEYFATVNRLREQEGIAGAYHFYFLSPSDYSAFFEAIRDQSHAGFLSRLQADLR